MNWFADHWDKAIGVLLSAVISGVVGFFSAVFVLQDRLASLESRAAVLENISNTSIPAHGKRLGVLTEQYHALNLKFTTMDAQSSLLISQNERLLLLRLD
jgi:hypothetical protein